MGVHVDHRRHDRLARQIDTRRVSWNREAALLADCAKAPAVDDKGGALDHAIVADDQSCAFVEDWAGSRTRRLRDRRGSGEKQRSGIDAIFISAARLPAAPSFLLNLGHSLVQR